MRRYSPGTETRFAWPAIFGKIRDRRCLRPGAVRMTGSSEGTVGTIPFVKASACGNDFLIIDGLHAPADLPAFSQRLCDRHNGVGADGVEWLFPAQDADIRARLINADGSDAEISGNGTRCVAAYWCSQDDAEQVNIRTDAGVKRCTLTSREGTKFEFEAAMGE